MADGRTFAEFSCQIEDCKARISLEFVSRRHYLIHLWVHMLVLRFFQMFCPPFDSVRACRIPYSWTMPRAKKTAPLHEIMDEHVYPQSYHVMPPVISVTYGE